MTKPYWALTALGHAEETGGNAQGTDMASLSENDLDYIHWRSMGLMLPNAGVAAIFAMEEARTRRLVEVRWPDGPRCSRCGADRPRLLSTRAVFQCRACRHQFSAISDTPLHRTRLDLGVWFHVAELLIQHHQPYWKIHHVTVYDLAEMLGIQYVAAHWTCRIVLADIGCGGVGFLRSTLCIKALDVPTGIAKNSEEHLQWMLAQ